MKIQYYSVLVLLAVVLSCKPEPQQPAATAEPGTSRQSTAITPPTEQELEAQSNETQVGEMKSYCYALSDKYADIELQFETDGKHAKGTIKIDSKSEDLVNGTFTGKNHGDEYILNTTYTWKGKECKEVMILAFDMNSANLARSGTIRVDGEKQERNDGQGSMDILDKVDC